MSYIIKTHKQVDKFLEKHREIAKRYLSAIDELAMNPFENTLDIKPLSWKQNHYRFRIWKYRFLYEISNNEILVFVYDVDSRWWIYR